MTRAKRAPRKDSLSQFKEDTDILLNFFSRLEPHEKKAMIVFMEAVNRLNRESAKEPVKRN